MLKYFDLDYQNKEKHIIFNQMRLYFRIIYLKKSLQH